MFGLATDPRCTPRRRCLLGPITGATPMSTRCQRIASLVLTFSLAAGSGWADSVVVEATQANVRKDPNVASPVVTTVSRGDVLEVIERASAWYRVKTADGLEGYVSARLLKAGAPPAATGPPAR